MSSIRFNVYDDVNRIDEPVKIFKKEFKSKYWDVGYWDQQGFFDSNSDWIPSDSDGDASLNFEIILKKKFNDDLLISMHSIDSELWSGISGTNNAMSCQIRLAFPNDQSNKLKFGKAEVNDNYYTQNEISRRKADLVLTEDALNLSFEELMTEFSKWALKEYKTKHWKINN